MAGTSKFANLRRMKTCECTLCGRKSAGDGENGRDIIIKQHEFAEK